jgi:hypothetical protein
MADTSTLDLSLFRPVTARDFVIARASRDDYWDWLRHVASAGECRQPIRLRGEIYTVERTGDSAVILDVRHTADMPDGVIYKPCGNRRASICPACSRVYQRDAYHLVRAGLVGGKGIPETVAEHPSLFVTLTAPSFGPVHTRPVAKHTCTNRRRCDCRPRPCHPGRDRATCEHGRPVVCWARHELEDPQLGQPLCLDCYDHAAQVVWNNQAGELWRRTSLAITRSIRRAAKRRGIDPDAVKVSFGKVAEMQRRGAVHFHIVMRLDGRDPDNPDAILPPPAGLGLGDLVDAVEHAAKTVMFVTDPHPAKPSGWLIAWGEQIDVRTINLGGGQTITDSMVAGYLAKYATKSTEATGHTSRRLDAETIDIYADPDGTHPERLVDACWTLGAAGGPWRSLRRWAHMLGFGGHFLTKSRRYSVTFQLLRETRVIWRQQQTTGPQRRDQGDAAEQTTTLVINFLEFVGSGWRNPGDAMLALSAAARAREQREAARDALTTASAD